MAKVGVDSGYYGNERREIARLVPLSALTILDVGCGKGMLGKLLKSSVNERKVYGVEYEPSIANEATKVLDGVLTGDVQTMTISFPMDYFDCLIFADILEHLLDPVAVLRKFKPHLKKNGVILCSIPNIRHYTTFLKVLKGWEYDDYGLFDRTHLRFFSLKTMEHLLHDSGFELEYYEPREVASRKMRILNAICLNQMTDFLAFQYLLRAHPI